MYKAHRRQFAQSRTTTRHHAAWGIVCVLLITVILALMTTIQSLQSKTHGLELQLARAKTVQTTCKPTGNWQPNTTTELMIPSTSGGRTVFVHVPQDFSAHHYYPLLLFYPGKSATAQGAESAYGLDALPAIVAYPSPSVGLDGHTAWEGAPYSSSADDVAFTTGILDKLQSDLCIDRTRIYAAGMSNGGGFASLLSCRLPDKFAAYAIVSGAMYYPNGECKPDRPTPLITIHSDSDPIVPFMGSTARQLPPIYNWTAMRADMNGCTKTQTTQPQPSIVTTTWTSCNADATVQNVVVHGGGHTWGQVSNDYLWQFLSQFSL